MTEADMSFLLTYAYTLALVNLPLIIYACSKSSVMCCVACSFSDTKYCDQPCSCSMWQLVVVLLLGNSCD